MAIRKKSVVGTTAGLLNGGVALFVAVRVFHWVLTNRWPAPEDKLWPFLLALAVLLVNVAYLVIFFREAFGGGELRYISTKTPDGSARISVRALKTELRRRVLEEAGIAVVRIRLRREAEDKVRITATIKTARGHSAVELAGRVREVLRSSFFRVVPDDGTLKLHVIVKIASLSESVAAEPETAEPAEEPADREPEMFTGPRYPVEDMEGV